MKFYTGQSSFFDADQKCNKKFCFRRATSDIEMQDAAGMMTPILPYQCDTHNPSREPLQVERTPRGAHTHV